jgi:hypothetical protein
MLRSAAIVVFAVALIVLAQDVFIPPLLIHQARMTTDFSPAYLAKKLQALAAASPAVVFLGDSAIWGYGLPPAETAIAILRERGCDCVNLSFKAGNAPNDYALVRLFAAYGVRPKLVVLEVNQRSLNSADQSYKSLHPAIAALAGPFFTPQDRDVLAQPAPRPDLRAQLDGALSNVWAIYAMRADLRAVVNGDVDALPKKKMTADQFMGTYDLSPLDERNVGVLYLEKTIDELHQQGIPVVAFMTPTNHVLLHEYIDDPAYGANGDYLKNLLQKRGVRTIDLDRAFPTDEFIDNAHLTKQGQIRLADTLSSRISALESP